MIITSLISKVLAITEYVLDYFVLLTPTGQNIGNADCGFVIPQVVATITPCGQGLLDNIMALTYGLVELAPQLLAGLFVIQGW